MLRSPGGPGQRRLGPDRQGLNPGQAARHASALADSAQLPRPQRPGSIRPPPKSPSPPSRRKASSPGRCPAWPPSCSLRSLTSTSATARSWANPYTSSSLSQPCRPRTMNAQARTSPLAAERAPVSPGPQHLLRKTWPGCPHVAVPTPRYAVPRFVKGSHRPRAAGISLTRCHARLSTGCPPEAPRAYRRFEAGHMKQQLRGLWPAARRQREEPGPTHCSA